MRLNGNNDFHMQLEMLRENLANNGSARCVAPGMYCWDGGGQASYWLGTEDTSYVSLIIDTNTNGRYRKVTMTSKNPDIPGGTPPFASDAYALINSDAKCANLVFTSDEMLSDSGAKLWKNVAASGQHVGVYDTADSKYVLKHVSTPAELADYIGGEDMGRYLFVLSESRIEFQGTRHAFSILELKRNAGYPLFLQQKARGKVL